MKSNIKLLFWFWKEFTWIPFKNKWICRFKGHDWIDLVSIAGGYTISRRCKRCPKEQIQNGWVDRK